MITPDMLLNAGILLGLRILNNAISTVRLIMLARQRRFLTAFLGFFEALIFAITIAGVVTDLTNILNLISYCLGFSIGGYIGMSLEARFITRYMIVNVFTDRANGHAIALMLRDKGFGVTETVGEGKDGEVVMLRSVVAHRDVPKVVALVEQQHERAFVAIEEAQTIQRGYIRAVRSIRNQPS